MDVPRTAKPRLPAPLLYLAGGGVALLAITVALGRLGDAAPSLERDALWIDTVRRGEFVRQVAGPGSLVPESIRFVSARTAGRVEQILVEPGSQVGAETPLVLLSNPELELETLEAERQLTSAEASLVDLEATLESELLAVRGELARMRAEHQDAARRAAANDRLAEQDMVAPIEHARSRDMARQLRARVGITVQRLESLRRSGSARVEGKRAEVERLAELASHQRALVGSLEVRAGRDGVLQELPLEVGQAVRPGDLLAKVVDPTRLKAELRIAENQAREVQIGQPVEVDMRSAKIAGRVTRIDPAVQRGTVTVDVALAGDLPRGARPDLSVDGHIELERVPDTVFTGRPSRGAGRGRGTIFRLSPDGASAERTVVEFGGSSASTIEIKEGLSPGDRVILSDMGQWDAVDRISID